MESNTVTPSGAVNHTPSFSALSLKFACNTPWTLSLSHHTNKWSPGVMNVLPGSESGNVYFVKLAGSSEMW